MFTRVFLLASKKARVGASVRDLLACANACSWPSVHMQLFFVLSKGRSGDITLATFSILDESWLTNPKKERRSDLLAGVGNCDIASVMDWSTL